MSFEHIDNNRGSKILVVDDNKLNIQILASLLEINKFEVSAVNSGENALKALKSKQFNMVLLDVMMPVMDGFETCRQIKKNSYFKDIPIIFITARDDAESIRTGFHLGGIDYITKPFNSIELVARINTHLTLQKRTAELKEALRREKILASTDSLTKIYNRLKFDILLEQKIKVTKRYKEPLSIIFFDIDHFKKINDTYGHKIGDIVLIDVSKIVKKEIRVSDVFARWGGEEFILYLPKTDISGAKEMANKLNYRIAKYRFEDIDKSITCSFGVTSFKENDTQDSLILRADDAMYNAKNQGRNRVEVL